MKKAAVLIIFLIIMTAPSAGALIFSYQDIRTLAHYKSLYELTKEQYNRVQALLQEQGVYEDAGKIYFKYNDYYYLENSYVVDYYEAMLNHHYMAEELLNASFAPYAYRIWIGRYYEAYVHESLALYYAILLESSLLQQALLYKQYSEWAVLDNETLEMYSNATLELMTMDMELMQKYNPEADSYELAFFVTWDEILAGGTGFPVFDPHVAEAYVEELEKKYSLLKEDEDDGFIYVVS